METPKKTAVFRKIVPADGTIAACRRERNFGTFRYETAAHQNVTPLPQRDERRGKEKRARAKNSHQAVFPQPGKKRRIGAEYAIETDPLQPKRSPILEKATTNSRSL
jgi:hypothetical protein